LNLLVPGDLNTRTGGYIYDRRIVDGLRRIGCRVDTHSLDASFPQPTAAALEQARSVFSEIPDESIVVIDGLALGGLSKLLEVESRRVHLTALIHHPLAFETGLAAETVRLLRQSERASLERVHGVIVTSRWTLTRLVADYGVPAGRIRVVEPGTDGVPDVPQCGVTDESSLDLLCVATLTPRKGHAVLFDALARLRDRRWQLRCAGSLTGNPATAAALLRQIECLQLGPRINLLGEIDTPALELEYGRCSLFVLASYMEGYGMALADAIAHGKPIISTLAGAIPDTVPTGAGLFVPPGDDRALSDALASVMDDPKVRRRLAGNAFAARKSLPTWSQASERFAAALADLAVGNS
jgi:glycosyltransferase involved in cell wall biosynthesis